MQVGNTRGLLKPPHMVFLMVGEHSRIPLLFLVIAVMACFVIDLAPGWENKQLHTRIYPCNSQLVWTYEARRYETV